jgi:hypothetical protein
VTVVDDSAGFSLLVLPEEPRPGGESRTGEGQVVDDVVARTGLVEVQSRASALKPKAKVDSIRS